MTPKMTTSSRVYTSSSTAGAPSGPGGTASLANGPAPSVPRLESVSRTLVVKATAGADAPERCAQAVTVAATALASGVAVSLWLTGEASWLAVPGHTVELDHSAPLTDLRDAVLAGGTLTLCTQCAARRGIGEADVLPGVRLAGAAVFVSEVLAEGAQALVY